MTVEVIAADFVISRPAVSKHLRILHEARLVKVTPEGRKRLYELDPGPLASIDAWLTRVRLRLAARLMELKLQVEDQKGNQE